MVAQMKPSNDNRTVEEARERELRALAISLSCKLPGLAPFDYEWEQLKPADLTPEELDRLKGYVRYLDQAMTEIMNREA